MIDKFLKGNISDIGLMCVLSPFIIVLVYVIIRGLKKGELKSDDNFAVGAIVGAILLTLFYLVGWIIIIFKGGFNTK